MGVEPDRFVSLLELPVLSAVGAVGQICRLIEALGNTNDWRLVYVAAESLGRLRTKDSICALTRISHEHWYMFQEAYSFGIQSHEIDGVPVKVYSPAKWEAFIRKSKPDVEGQELPVVISEISTFIMPVLEALRMNDGFDKEWSPEKGWNS